MYQTKIAFRSLLYRKTQYVSLFLVCMFGVAISLTAICLSNGMMSSLNQKAKIYYGGDVTLMCSNSSMRLAIFDYDQKVAQIESILPEGAVVSQRLDFDARHSSFYFEGVQALQQTIKGVNFKKESDLISRFTFVEGGLDGMDGSNGVLISSPIAKMLNVKVGDEITFQLTTVDKYLNTLPVVVKGIFQDSSVFGMYTSYMDFEFLRDAYGRPKNYANRICINFPDRNIKDRDLHKMYESLASQMNFYPYLNDKDDFLDVASSLENETWGFIPLDANLNDVEIMRLAMDAVISFIVVVLTIIIIAGIGSTYRVLVMKRITEIGIYMAVGMKKRSIEFTLLFEALILLIAGCIAGIILSFGICRLSSVFDFSFIPSFDLFLEKGNLVPRLDVFKCAFVIIPVVVVTLLAVYYSTRKSIKIMPVAALAVTE